MTYGPLSSAANIGTSMLSSYLAPELEKVLPEAISSPWLRKAIAAGVPALASGGIGAALSGDKYGMLNALPSGIMGYLSMPDGAGGATSSDVSPKASPIPGSTKQGLADDDVLGTFLEGKPKSSISNIATQSSPLQDSTTTAANDVAKAPTEGAKGGDDMGGIFGKLMSTPEGKMMVAMMLGNTFSSLATTAGTDAYYNDLNRQTNQANALVGQQQRRYINKSLGYAPGGYISTEQVNPDNFYPQSQIPKAKPYLAATPIRHEVVSEFKHGELVGPGDGMSDSIEANIDGKRKAKVATGEFVVPREAAEKYGDKLNKMMKAVRAAAHPKKGQQVKQDAAKREFIKQMSGIKA